jgi:hypothetical protein
VFRCALEAADGRLRLAAERSAVLPQQKIPRLVARSDLC